MKVRHIAKRRKPIVLMRRTYDEDGSLWSENRYRLIDGVYEFMFSVVHLN
jgi:hypothetical protein